MGIYSVVNPSGKRRYGVSYSYFDEDGEKKCKRKIIGTRKEAEAEWDRIKRGDMLRGIFEDIAQKKIPTMSEACDQFWEGYGKELKSQGTLKTFLKKFKKLWGSIPINEIDRQTISDYAKGLLKEGRAISSVSREIGVLKFIFDWVTQQKGLDLRNPAKAVLKFASPEIRRKARSEAKERMLEYWEMDEIGKILAACKDYQRNVILWAYNSLMRKGEILGARWEHIDKNRMALNIPKTKTGVPRDIPIRGILHDILDNLGWKEEGLIFRWCTIFESKGFHVLLRRAGIEAKKGKGFHKLRSSGATHLLKLGTDPLIVQRLGGWEDPRILFQTYAKLGQNLGDKGAAIEALGKFSLQIMERFSEEVPDRVIQKPSIISETYPS